MKHASLLMLFLLSSFAFAHEGHGMPGTVAHDLQHQLWTFAALVAVSALLLAGERLLLRLRAGKPGRPARSERRREP